MKKYRLISVLAVLMLSLAFFVPALAAPSEDQYCQSYTVKAGDTLSGVARAQGYVWEQVAQQNGIHAPYTIRIGQVLHLCYLTAPGQGPIVITVIPADVTQNPTATRWTQVMDSEIRPIFEADAVRALVRQTPASDPRPLTEYRRYYLPTRSAELVRR
jgi:hypothetical protein